MLIEEAKWIGDNIVKLDDASELFPMLDVGSGSSRLRKERQPWVDEYLFSRIETLGGEVKHLDAKQLPGVDIVGNIQDPRITSELVDMGFKSVLCCNLLEHVEDRDAVARAVLEVLPKGGHLIITCPFKCPYHPHPIDTLYRPNLQELKAMFPKTEILNSAIVSSGPFLAYQVKRLKKYGLPLNGSLCEGTEEAGWDHFLRSILSCIMWSFQELSATCLVARKS